MLRNSAVRLRHNLKDSVCRQMLRTQRIFDSRRLGRFKGCVERVEYRTISGWAHNVRCPDEPIFLQVQVNGADVGVSVAGKFNGNGKAPSRREPGRFEFSIPDSVGEIESVRVVLAETQRELACSVDDLTLGTTNRAVPYEWQSGSKFRYPSFFLLGAAKCGMTPLHAYLDQHPEICMSKPKEPTYFEAELDRHGTAYYFNRYFSHWAGEPIVGESRHRNLYLPYVSRRLFDYNPDARLLVILRNPVERAISHWWHWYSRGKETLRLREALEADLKRIDAGYRLETENEQAIYKRTAVEDCKGMLRTYLDSGYYDDQIQRYLALFPRERLKIVLFEDFSRDPQSVLLEAGHFLGADPRPIFKLDCAQRQQSRSAAGKHVDNATVSWLAEHFQPHNLRLEEMLDRSLKDWNSS